MVFSISMPDLCSTTATELASHLRSSRALHREVSFSESDVGSIEDSLPLLAHADAMTLSGSDAAALLQQATRMLDANYAEAMTTMSDPERDLVLTMQTCVEQGPQEALRQVRPGTPAQTLALRAQAYLDATGAGDATDHARCIGMLDFLGKVVNNQFSEDHWRWAANFANAGVRTGLIVALTTVLRQLIGFELEKALQLGDAAFSSRELLGLSAMLLGSGLNLAGAMRDEINHTATLQSRLSRGSMAALSIGALMLASQIGEPSVLGASMSSIGVQTASYTLARDLMQLFFPLYDNAEINLGGTVVGAVSYSAAQIYISEAMDRFSPSSGAGRVMAVARSVPTAEKSMLAHVMQWFVAESNPAAVARTAATGEHAVADKVRRAISALQPDLAQDMTRGVLNAVVEVSDDLVRTGISRALQVRQAKAAAQAEALAEGRDPATSVAALPRELTDGLRLRLGMRMPNATQAADQFLNVGAMRTSAFEVIMGMAMSAAVAMEKTNLSAANQLHAVNAVVGVAAAMIYSSFVYVNVQAPAPAQNKASQEPTAATVLRRRCVSKAAATS